MKDIATIGVSANQPPAQTRILAGVYSELFYDVNTVFRATLDETAKRHKGQLGNFLSGSSPSGLFRDAADYVFPTSTDRARFMDDMAAAIDTINPESGVAFVVTGNRPVTEWVSASILGAKSLG